MIRNVLIICVIVLSSLCSVVASAALQTHYINYRAEYFVTELTFMEKYLPFLKFTRDVPLSGKIDETLRRNADGTWLFERSGLVYGFKAREFSQFRAKGSVIEPMWYFRNQTGIFKDNKVEVRFPSGNTSVFDPMTFGLRIALDLQKDPRRKTFIYKVTEDAGKSSKLQTYAVTGKDAIDTAIGTMLTVIVSRTNSDNIGREYILWLAPELNYLLLRSRTLQDGIKKIELNIKEGTMGGRQL